MDHTDPGDDGAGAGDGEEHDAQLSVGDPVAGKSRLLSRQCATCIFRPGNTMRLRPGRLRDLVTQALAREGFIVCHSTLPHYLYPDAHPAICRGFADRYSTQALQIIARLFGFIDVDPPGEPGPTAGPGDEPDPHATPGPVAPGRG